MTAGKFRFSLAMVATLLLGLAACSDPTGPQVTLGTYQMQTFRGEQLPARSTDGTLYVRSGTIELMEGNRFRLEMDTDYCRADDCGPTMIVEEGTFTAQSGFLTLNTNPVPLNGRFYVDYLTLADDTPVSMWVLVE